MTAITFNYSYNENPSSLEDIMNNISKAGYKMSKASSPKEYDEAKAAREYWSDFSTNIFAVAEADILEAEASGYCYITDTSSGNINIVFKGGMFSLHSTASGDCLFASDDRDEFIEKLAHYYQIEIG